MKKKLTLRIPVWLIVVVVLAVNIWILFTQVFTTGFWDRQLLNGLTPEDIQSMEFGDSYENGAVPLPLNERQIRQVVEALNGLEPKGEPYPSNAFGLGFSCLNLTLKNGDTFSVKVTIFPADMPPRLHLFERDSGWRQYELYDQEAAVDQFIQVFLSLSDLHRAQVSN